MKNLAYTEKSQFINPRLSEHSHVMEQKIYKIGENIYSAVGYALNYPTMIVGDDGIILVDASETIGSMEEIMKEFRKITDLPVKAFILTHNHGDHWGGMTACVSQQESDNGSVLVVGHEELVKNVAQSSSELLDIRMGRAVWMYGNLLPKGEHGAVNLGLGPVLDKGITRFVTPNTIVNSNETFSLTVSGVEMEIFFVESEAADEIAVYFKKEKVLHVAEVLQGESFPNIYTVRGQTRDAKKWYKAVETLRTYHPDSIVGCHIRPLEGKEACEKLLSDYGDAIQYAHDQTVRLLNQGNTIEAIMDEIGTLPPHLFQADRMGEFYGTFRQAVRAIYDNYLGWFNGEPTALNPISATEASKRYIKLMGGRENVLMAAQQSLEDKEYEWASELASHLVRIDFNDITARQVKATACRMMGYASENATWRNWYLTCAIELEGAFEEIVKHMGTNGGFPPFSESFLDVSTYNMLEAMKVKLNGPKTFGTNMAVKCNIEGECFVLQIRKGVLQVHGPHEIYTEKLDCECTVSHVMFAKLMAKDVTPCDANQSGDLQVSDEKILSEFFNCFDAFTPFVDMPFCFQ
ncbi:alkyl sulfatase dimerization domain-containing protein [Pygmaiobacter massiliensis]|uniref:alkyl sulfatase dimerization domain-containing protein n=1 Tax=Pygmaiobacter massiliensis TaxID=1917873 RepID=UPI000C7E479B|nr:alkyl sulfatase dimerization domain-containing protein [Pygmaiobacter massiliensis]